jgi:hypothetical protein
VPTASDSQHLFRRVKPSFSVAGVCVNALAIAGSKTTSTSTWDWTSETRYNGWNAVRYWGLSPVDRDPDWNLESSDVDWDCERRGLANSRPRKKQ